MVELFEASTDNSFLDATWTMSDLFLICHMGYTYVSVLVDEWTESLQISCYLFQPSQFTL